VNHSKTGGHSYEKDSAILSAAGRFQKALQFFEQRDRLSKELYEANPHSESLKNGLAISYSRLGDINSSRECQKGFTVFDQYNELLRMYEANPQVNYLKTTSPFLTLDSAIFIQQQGDFKKAYSSLTYTITKDCMRQSTVILKNGLPFLQTGYL
jgi:tetratricopeptide (TPR) repeat protein